MGEARAEGGEEGVGHDVRHGGPVGVAAAPARQPDLPPAGPDEADRP